MHFQNPLCSYGMDNFDLQAQARDSLCCLPLADRSN